MREQSRCLARTVLALDEFGAAAAVACYLAMPGEVVTRDILEACWSGGRRVSVPASRGRGAGYDMAALSRDTVLVRGPGGPLEPRDKDWVPWDDVALVLVPGVAFDTGCARLGRGGGHYDRLLGRPRHRPPVKVGVAFDFQVFGRIPRVDTDVAMDVVVTETRTIRPPGGR